jgi:hypothetical protein
MLGRVEPTGWNPRRKGDASANNMIPCFRFVHTVSTFIHKNGRQRCPALDAEHGLAEHVICTWVGRSLLYDSFIYMFATRPSIISSYNERTAR